MQYIKDIGELQKDLIEFEFGNIRTTEVIVTQERLCHIEEHHPQDMDLFKRYGKEVIQNPDIIVKDEKNIGTVFMIKKLTDMNLNAVVKLVTDEKNIEIKNSIMTFYRIRDVNLEKMIRKNKLLYKKE